MSRLNWNHELFTPRVPTRAGGRVESCHRQALRAAGGVTARETAARTGATMRMLQLWDECGFIRPSHGKAGHLRGYSDDQVCQIRDVVKMRKAGVTLQRIRWLYKRRLAWEHVEVITGPRVIRGTLFIAGRL